MLEGVDEFDCDNFGHEKWVNFSLLLLILCVLILLL